MYHARGFTYDAVLQHPPFAGSAEGCGLRLYFERPGTLRVRETDAGCTAAAVGTYTKVSAICQHSSKNWGRFF